MKLRGSRTYGPFHLLLLDWPVKLCYNKIPTKWVFFSKIRMCSSCRVCQWGCDLLLFSVSAWCLSVHYLGLWRINRPASVCCHVYSELSLQCCHLRYTSQLWCVSLSIVCLARLFSLAPLLPCSIFWGDTACCCAVQGSPLSHLVSTTFNWNHFHCKVLCNSLRQADK